MSVNPKFFVGELRGQGAKNLGLTSDKGGITQVSLWEVSPDEAIQKAKLAREIRHRRLAIERDLGHPYPGREYNGLKPDEKGNFLDWEAAHGQQYAQALMQDVFPLQATYDALGEQIQYVGNPEKVIRPGMVLDAVPLGLHKPTQPHIHGKNCGCATAHRPINELAAEKELAKALGEIRSTNDPIAMFRLGRILQESGNIMASMGFFRLSIERSGDSKTQADAYFRMGINYERLDLPERAEHSFRQANQYEPDSVGILNRLGLVLEKQGKTAEAQYYYERCRQLSRVEVVEDEESTAKVQFSGVQIASLKPLNAVGEIEWGDGIKEKKFRYLSPEGKALAFDAILNGSESRYSFQGAYALDDGRLITFRHRIGPDNNLCAFEVIDGKEVYDTGVDGRAGGYSWGKHSSGLADINFRKTREDLRGKGIGSLAFDKMEADIAARGFKWVSVRTEKDEVAEFLGHRGYSEAGGGMGGIILVKQLSPQTAERDMHRFHSFEIRRGGRKRDVSVEVET